MAAMPGYERAELLRRCADELVTRAADIGRVMARETGKAIRDCIVEAVRSADTFRLSAEEAVRIQGEHIPMDASAIGAGKLAVTMRFPVGVVAAITPFNGPLNLAAHKVGPALAGGNAVVLKPSPKASLCTWLFVEALAAAGVPAGAVNAVYGDAVGEQLVVDPRVDFVTFTGSIPVGKLIRRAVGLKPVTLELGGVGPTFVHHDGDLAAAAAACARNGMLLAGQSCVSVQNVFVAAGVYDEFLELLNAEVARIRFGDPLDPQTEVGTLIDEAAAARVAGIVGPGGRRRRPHRRGRRTGRGPAPGDRADRRHRGHGGGQQRDFRSGRDRLALRADRAALPADLEQPLRASVRHLHQVNRAEPGRRPVNPHRRGDRQRDVALAIGSDALRRGEG